MGASEFIEIEYLGQGKMRNFCQTGEFEARVGSQKYRVLLGISLGLLELLKGRWPSQKADSNQILERTLVRIAPSLIVEYLEDIERSGEKQILLNKTNCSLLVDEPPPSKGCEYYKRENNRIVCSIGRQDDGSGGLTTDEICEECAFPDALLRCANLVISETVSYSAAGRIEERRPNVACNKGEEGFSVSNICKCRPGTRICFEPVIIRVPIDRPKGRLGYLKGQEGK